MKQALNVHYHPRVLVLTLWMWLVYLSTCRYQLTMMRTLVRVFRSVDNLTSSFQLTPYLCID